jgi:hypothetical protein
MTSYSRDALLFERKLIAIGDLARYSLVDSARAENRLEGGRA